MSDLDNFNSALDDANRQLKSYSDLLKASADTLSSADKGEKSAAEKEKKVSEQIQKLGNTVNTVAQNMLGIVKTLSSGNAFATAKSVVNATSSALDSVAGSMKGYGNLVKGVSTGLSGTATLIIDAFEKAYGTFEKLSSVGAVSTFEDMRNSANAMELNFTQYNDFLSKHSKDLALFGGSVITGRKEFEKLAADSYLARRDFQKLGISTDEFTEFQVNYIEQQLRIGRGQSIVTANLNDETQSYILQVDGLSKLYGQSRQSIMDQRKKRLEEVGFAVFLRGLTGDQQRATQLFLDILSGETQDEQFVAGTQKLLQNGFRAVDDTTQQITNLLAQQGHLDLNETRRLLETGTEENAVKAAQMVSDALRSVNLQATPAAQLFGTNNFISAQYKAAINVQSRQQHDILEEYNNNIEAAKKNMADQKSQNSTLADAIQNIEAAKRNIDQAATSSKVAATALDEMTDAIDAFAEQILTDTNQKLPPELQAKKELRQATSKSNRAKEDYESALTGEKTDIFGRPLPEWFIEDMKKQYEEAKGKEIIARSKLNSVMAVTRQSPDTQTDAQRVATFTKGYENVVSRSKNGAVGIGVNAYVSNQEEQYPKVESGSKYSIPTPSVPTPTTPTAPEASTPSVPKPTTPTTPEVSTPSVPKPTTPTTPTTPKVSTPSVPKPTTPDVIPPKMNIGGMINDLSLPRSEDQSMGNAQDETNTTSDQQDIGTRSLNTSFITNSIQDTIDFDKVYNEVSVKFDRLISLMSDSAKLKKKQLQMKIT